MGGQVSTGNPKGAARRSALRCFAGLLVLTVACTRAPQAPPLVVYAAGSLARPLGAALDSFRVATGIDYSLVPSGSLDLARRVTELGQVPDVMALADEDVFGKILMPDHVTWYARFATNRMVVARRRGGEPLGAPWWERLTRPGVEVGRSDPDLDPAGYRTLMAFDLAERHAGIAGLSSRLRANADPRFMRPKSAELIALLQAGELDYAWLYESSARGADLPFDSLPSAVDLGAEADSAVYATVSVRVQGRGVGDTIVLAGAPIHYGITVPTAAAQPAVAMRLLQYLFGPDGQRILQREYLRTLSPPGVVGAAPAELR